VRGTVRSTKPWLNKYFDGKYGIGKFKTKIVEALNDEGAFDKVIKGVAGVVHVVCPKPTPSAHPVLPTSVLT
jgi:hypothetical protein